MAGLVLVSRLELVVELEHGSGPGDLWFFSAGGGLVPSSGRKPLGCDYAGGGWNLGPSYRRAASPHHP